MATATIKLFLLHGDPNRLRTAEISNWSGKAIAAPRTDLEELIDRSEAGQSAIYILNGSEPETGRAMAYVGEAEILRERLRQHRNKDFWVSVIAFVSKDENLTKAHIRFLEGKLLEEALAIGRFHLENGMSSGSRLPEADRHEMEEFFGKMQQLLPVLGSDILTPVIVTNGADPSSAELTTTVKGLTARGRRTPTGFVVYKASEAVVTDRSAALPWSINKRRGLIEEGILRKTERALIFERDVEFTSPSSAAAVIHGGNTNGLLVWRDSIGRSLKDLEAP
jgi:hypothetical protein